MKKHTLAALLAAVLLTVPAALPAHAQEAAETGDTFSCIGSVSKMFTTTAVMQLVDEGKVDLDAPVTDYLPSFRMADPRYKDITVRMLADHTSGLLGTTAGDFMLFDDRAARPHDGLLEELATQRLKADPGDFAAYCNDGFELLAILVEEVSGEPFTDYVRHHISDPLGLVQTGTPWDTFRSSSQVETFLSGRIPFATDYCMDIGSGGISSTAPELCRFGSAFFPGDTTLLSEKSKKAMAARSLEAPYEDCYGLGWDIVSHDDYDAAGVQIVAKGGDIIEQHATLVVAPEQEISVSVLSSGGSSMYDELMALSLVDIALEEQGITVEHPEPAQMETLDTVPEQYLSYAGVYFNAEGVCTVAFPEGKYMEITSLTGTRRKVTQYLYTTEDDFVEMDGNIATGKAVQAKDQTCLHFGQRGGRDYLLADSYMDLGRTGRYRSQSYMLQRADAPTASAEAQAAWDARDGKKYYLYSAKYSNCYYAERPAMTIQTYPEAPGFAGAMSIVDADHARSMLAMPGGRDILDVTMYREDGAEFCDMTNNAMTCICEDAMEPLGEDVTEVALHTGRAAWYTISDTPGQTLTLDIPDEAAVYVYDAYDRMTYSSYMLGYGSTVPLPSGGKIVFVGEDGGTVKITR
ncbi:MAG: beta-lactamase family protein [Oscillospiraceae bacterium]|nr:beta-lactamase family protein [Oscillospiraceae bacterium]